MIKGKFTRSPATSIFFDRKQEMKKHYQIRQHKHKSLLLRDFQFQLACSYLIWFIAVDDQHKEPMMYVYKDHLDGKLTTLYICIKTSKNLNQDDENRQTTNVVETFPFKSLAVSKSNTIEN